MTKSKSARDAVMDMARVVKKQLRGKTAAQRRTALHGYWRVAVDHHPTYAPFRDLFMTEAM